ncbi:MAG: ATP-binding protein [Clostridia bacterium]|nr:ATP-binding protein [Clostridia bacterium]
MKEISLHILDILQNSITAGASLVELCITEDAEKDIFKFYIKDNGKGMDKEFLKNVTSPFTTKRTTRKVGLGIPLLKLAAESTGGGINISSELGVGTTIEAVFSYSHIDRQPLGNIVDTMFTVITAYENTDFLYIHKSGDREFKFDTREIKKILGGVALSEPDVMAWLLDYLKEGEAGLTAE